MPPEKRTEPEPDPERARRRRHRRAGAYIATASAVVGLLTGLFTLRENIFGGDQSTVEDTELVAFRGDVGRVCDGINNAGNETVRRLRSFAPRVREATTVRAVRGLLMRDTRQRLAARSALLSRVAALEPPDRYRAEMQIVVTLWSKNLAALRAHAGRLNVAATRPDLVDALLALPDLGAGEVRATTALRRMGGERCDLENPDSAPNPTLPAVLEAQTPVPSASPQPSPPSPQPSPPSPQPSPEETVVQPTVFPTPTPSPSPPDTTPTAESP